MKTLQDIATPLELERYADVLVNCALGHGKGIEPGEVVLVSYSQASSILVPFIQKAVTKVGGHLLHEPNIFFPPEYNLDKQLIENGTPEQVSFYPLSHKEALYKLAQHKISLRTEDYDTPKSSFDSGNEQARTEVGNLSIKLKSDFKENYWRSYTIAYVPSPALAQQSNISLEAFWQQVVKSCFLDQADCVLKARKALQMTKKIEDTLNEMKITEVHVTGGNCDLRLSFAPEARFRSSAGGNMPSYECFTTPLASKTEGWIKFSYPHIYRGNTIEGLKVNFKDGQVESWTATEGEETFSFLMSLEGMKRLGEFALTDSRISSIDLAIPGAKLYLENIGGTAHVAFGSGYKKCFADMDNTPDCNEANEHQDMVLGGDFTVEATLADGSKSIIFNEGKFTFF